MLGVVLALHAVVAHVADALAIKVVTLAAVLGGAHHGAAGGVKAAAHELVALQDVALGVGVVGKAPPPGGVVGGLQVTVDVIPRAAFQAALAFN